MLQQAVRTQACSGSRSSVLSQREQRHVSEQLTSSYDRKQLILERDKISEELGGKYVEIYASPDGRLEVRSHGHILPYRVFDKDQRVNPAAIVERKRLSHALSIIEVRQDATLVPRIQTNSEKGGYQMNPRQLYGVNLQKQKRAAGCSGNDGLMESVER